MFPSEPKLKVDLKRVEAALKEFPENEKLWWLWAREQFHARAFQKAVEGAQQLVALSPLKDAYHNFRGLCYYELGAWKEAEESFRQALALNAAEASYPNNLGALFLEEGRWKEALRCFAQAKGLAPLDAKVQTNLGVTFLSLGFLEKARQAFEKALREEERAHTAHIFLGRLEGEMRSLSFREGDEVRLYPRVCFKGENGGVEYATRVLETRGGRLTVAAPLEKGVPVLLHRGKRFLVGLPKRDGLYGFSAEVVDRAGGDIPYLTLAHFPEVHPGLRAEGEEIFQGGRVQRRKFVRVRSRLLVSLGLLKSPDPCLLPSLWEREVATEDISGGGLLVSVHKPLPRGSLVAMSFRLPDGPFDGLGEVVRSERKPLFRQQAVRGARREHSFQLGLAFQNLDAKRQARLVRFVQMTLLREVLPHQS